MAAFKSAFVSKAGPKILGSIDVGRDSYWWDYGLLKLYWQNNILPALHTPEAATLRQFLGIPVGESVVSSTTDGVDVSSTSLVIGSTLKAGSVKDSVIAGSRIGHVEVRG